MVLARSDLKDALEDHDNQPLVQSPDAFSELPSELAVTSDAGGRQLLVPGAAGKLVPLQLDGDYRERDVLIESYWHVHPRYLFIKSAPRNARVVDIGAGSGGMVGWSTWGAPERRDLAFYAVDVEKGEHFDRYLDYDIVEVGPDETKYSDDSFDLAVCSHVVHYVNDLDAFLRETARVTKPGGKIYVEWPNADAPAMSRKDFEPFGIECGTLGIADDSGQTAPIEDADLRESFMRAGCRMISDGVVENDYLYPELFRRGVREHEAEMTTYGLWLFLRFARYAIFEKVPAS